MADPLEEMSHREFLSREEEAALKREGSEESIAKLIDSHLPQLISIVSKRSRNDPHLLKDLVQVGFKGLKRAAETFDPDGGTLKTHVQWQVLGAIDRYITEDIQTVRVNRYQRRKKGKSAHISSLNVSVGSSLQRDKSNQPNKQDLLVDENMSPYEKEYYEDGIRQLGIAIAKLKEKQQFVVKRHLDGVNFRDIAEEMGCTHQNVSLHLHAAYESLRLLLIAAGYSSVAQVLGNTDKSSREPLMEGP